jgi:hypothetical protein
MNFKLPIKLFGMGQALNGSDLLLIGGSND